VGLGRVEGGSGVGVEEHFPLSSAKRTLEASACA
jgi:hypothetical protein